MDRPTPTPREGLPIGRAALLGTFIAGVAGIAAAPAVNRAISGAVPNAPVGLGGLGDLLPGLGGGWRIYSVQYPLPRFDPKTFQLSIGGLVENPQTLAWSEVAALPGERQTSDFHCVTGWSVQKVHWEGIRPQTIIDLVRPTKAAKYVTLQSLEGPYVDQVSLDQFRESNVMLARHMDGRPLTRSHGAPLRLVLPSMYGYKGVKWVREVRFDAKQAPGYWEQRGYDVDAYIGKSNGYG
jgi:DMSO/TMAO reductase YedYZ molybdopterin-dependent catalytic subunit